MKDLFEILKNDLLDTKKNLNKTIFIGLIFAIFGYLYVIEPYFLYKKQEIILNKKVSKKKSEIKNLTQKLKELELTKKNINNSMYKIKRNINSFPDQLRWALKEIRKSLNSRNSNFTMQQATPVSKIHLPPNIKEFEDAVQWYIENWFNNLINDLQKEVIKPALEISTENQKDKKELEKLSQEAIKKVKSYIKSVDPNFWRNYTSGKVPVARGLEKIVLKAINPIEIKIKEISKNLNNRIKEQKVKIENLEEKIKEINKQKAILKERLNSIESPIGKLPINLTDFIKTFPILLAIFIGMLYFYYSKMIKLSNYLKNIGEKANIEKEEINYFTEFWLIKKHFIIGIFALIFLIYLRSVYLILSDKSLFLLLTGKVNFNEQIFFTIFYILGGLFILGLYFILIKPYKKL